MNAAAYNKARLFPGVTSSTSVVKCLYISVDYFGIQTSYRFLLFEANSFFNVAPENARKHHFFVQRHLRNP